MRKLVFASVLLALICVSASGQKPYSFKVSDIKAKLFYDLAGTFSPEDVINDKNFTLFNTVIGEGSAAGMSEATLVLVEVTYGGLDDRNGAQLVFEAKGYKDKLLLRKSLFVSYVDKAAGLKKYVPFILHETGCAEIKLTASLFKDDKPKSPLLSKMTKTIPFVCGE
ncbi:MAG TPA: hypothetical protein VF604_19000 [Pyrinomonadaceae bacterium]|jgi:hypothetical protein